VHPAKKTTSDPAARKAREAKDLEREWSRNLKLTPEQRRDLAPSNSERAEARLRDALAVELLAGDPTSEALKSVVHRQIEALENERVRERGRRRPHKHLPSGLVELPFVVRRERGRDGIERDYVRPADKGDPGAKLAIGVRHRGLGEADCGEVSRFARVDESLARDAAALHAAFNVEPYDRDRWSHSTATRMMVRGEVVDAIRAAAQILGQVWISIALELVTEAIVKRIEDARGAVPMVETFAPPPATTTKGIYGVLERQMKRLGLSLPEHVDATAIAWMLDHLAVGTKRGGGRSAKLGAAQMRVVLGDPGKLARALAGPNSKRKRR
jgi:hypothetical protein